MLHLIPQERSLGEAIGLAERTDHSGDTFDRLVAEHQDRVARLVLRLMGWERDCVEDIVQDVFLAAFKRLGSFRGESAEFTWLAAIAINRCRSYRRRRVLEFRWLRDVRANEVAELESDLERDERAKRVRECVAALPLRDREVIVLYYLEEWSAAEIGKSVGISEATVNVRLHRARGRLKGALEELGEV